MKNKVYIMGGAQTDFERNWTKEGKKVIQIRKDTKFLFSGDHIIIYCENNFFSRIFKNHLY